MLFPDNFYQTEKEFKHVKTEEVTGYIEDAIDFIESPDRPWDDLQLDDNQSLGKKKKLIFADHFHDSRSREDQIKIEKRLQEALMHRFEVYYIDPEGKLVDYTEYDIDFPTYYLPPDKWKPNDIRDFLLQHNLTDDEVIILDLFGINALMGQETSRFDYASYHIHPQAMADYVHSMPNRQFDLYLGATDTNYLYSEELQHFIRKTCTQIKCLHITLSDPIKNDTFGFYKDYEDLLLYLSLQNHFPLHVTQYSEWDTSSLKLAKVARTLTTDHADSLLQSGPFTQLEKLVRYDATNAHNLLKNLTEKNCPRLKELELFTSFDLLYELGNYNLSRTLKISVSCHTPPKTNETQPQQALIPLQTISIDINNYLKLKDLAYHELIVSTEDWYCKTPCTELLTSLTQNKQLKSVKNFSANIESISDYEAFLNSPLVSDTARVDIYIEEDEIGSVQTQNHRIKTLTLANHDDLTTNLCDIFHQFPNLESLTLETGGYYELKGEAKAPHLRYLATPMEFTSEELEKINRLNANLIVELQGDIRFTTSTLDMLNVNKSNQCLRSTTFERLIRSEVDIAPASVSLSDADICYHDIYKASLGIENEDNYGIEYPEELDLFFLRNHFRHLKEFGVTIKNTANNHFFKTIKKNLPELANLSLECDSEIEADFNEETTLTIKKLTAYAKNVLDVPFSDNLKTLEMLKGHSSENRFHPNNFNPTFRNRLRNLKSITGNDSTNIIFLKMYLLTDPNSKVCCSKNDMLSIFQSLDEIMHYFAKNETDHTPNLQLTRAIKSFLNKSRYVLTDLKSMQALLYSFYPELDRINLIDPPTFMRCAHDMKQQSNSAYFNLVPNKQTQYTCVEYFPGVHPSLYRLKIRKPRLQSFGYDSLIARANFKPWVKSNRPADPEEKLYEGKALIPYEESAFYVLPSLQRKEVLKEFKVINSKHDIMDENEYQILYDDTVADLYAIQFNHPGNYFIQFQLWSTLATPENLPPPLKGLLDSYLLEFKEATEEAKENFYNASGFAKYLRKHKVGRCELRVLAACDEIEEANTQRPEASKWQYNTASNSVHEMIEICYENKWYLLNLGGYAANVLIRKITPPSLHPSFNGVAGPKPVPKSSARLFLTSNDDLATFQPPKPPKKVLMDVDVLIKTALGSTKPALLFLTSNDDLAAFYFKLANAIGENPREHIYCAYRISDLRLPGEGMTAEGEILPDYKPFHRWLKQNKTGCIVIDIRRFQDNEIGQLNDLLDRRLEQGKLAPGIAIIVIDQLNAREYNETFDRRIGFSGKIDEPLVNAMLDIPAESKETLPINLYKSRFWKRNIIGQWVFRGNQQKTAFTFRPGPLVKLKPDSPYKHLLITNPPKANGDFEIFLAEQKGFSSIPWADKSSDCRLTIEVDPTSHFNWEKLAKNAKLYSTVEPGTRVYVLSEKRLLSFIQSPRYIFEEKTEMLAPDFCFLEKHKHSNTPISIVPYQISEEGLAEFMSKAEELNVPVHIIQDLQLPHQTNPLYAWLEPEEKPLLPKLPSRLKTFIHSDPLLTLRRFLSDPKNKGTPFFSLAALTQSELSRISDNKNNVQDTLLQTNKLEIHSRYSDIAKRLFAGKDIILMGKIPSDLKPILKELALGYIDNKPFKGKIYLITTPDQLTTAKEISPFYETLTEEAAETKVATPTAALDMIEITELNDESRSSQFDMIRFSTVMNAFETEPVVKLVGESGSGKSYFADKILPKKYRFNDIVEWLDEIDKGDKIIFVIDEGNFAKQIGNDNAKLIERFVGLTANKRSFHPDEKAPFPYKGKIYYPSKNHCLLFLCNPASMGAGRSDAGLIHQLAFTINFKPLPYYHLRARMLPQHLKDWLKQENISSNELVEPIIQAYRWIREAQIAITPRQQILIYNIVFALVQENQIRDPEVLLRLSSHITYEVLSQLFNTNQKLLSDFQKHFMPSHPPILFQPSKKLTPEQTVAYSKVQCILHARKWMIQHKLNDIGLSSIVLEGPSEVGKTFVMSTILKDAGITYTRIAPLADEYEKAKKLKAAFHAGHLVVSEETNTGDWPQALLNQLLSGRDDKGNPAQQPGFLFLGTRNPASYQGRKTQDESARLRTLVITLDTKPYPKLSPALIAPKQLFKPTRKRRTEHGSLMLKQGLIVMSVDNCSNLNWIEALPKSEFFKFIIYTHDTSNLIKSLPFIQQMSRERPDIHFASPANELHGSSVYNFITDEVIPRSKLSKADNIIEDLTEDNALQKKCLSHVHNNIIHLFINRYKLTTLDEREFAKHAGYLYFLHEESLEVKSEDNEMSLRESYYLLRESFYLQHLKNISQDISDTKGRQIFSDLMNFILHMRFNPSFQNEYLEQLVEIMNPASLLILYQGSNYLEFLQTRHDTNEDPPCTTAEFKEDSNTLNEDLTLHIQKINAALGNKILSFLNSKHIDHSLSIEDLTTVEKLHQPTMIQLLRLSLDFISAPTAGNVSIYNQHAAHLINTLDVSIAKLAAVTLKTTLIKLYDRAERPNKQWKGGL